jgi:hypothetical protein
MKKLTHPLKFRFNLFILIILAGLTGCEKTSNYNVDEYISQLKSGQYTSYDLPAFKPSDIPALLNYRNDPGIITHFPRNGISSFAVPECKLGIYVLWTIESIRVVQINSEKLVGRFPSLNPILALNNGSQMELVFDDRSQMEAAKAYYEWWYSAYLLSDKMRIDPLKNTVYKWH